MATGVPEREIGLDSNRKAIMKMPDNRNYGYWTDNNLRLDDFKTLFAAAPIASETFNQYWEIKD